MVDASDRSNEKAGYKEFSAVQTQDILERFNALFDFYLLLLELERSSVMPFGMLHYMVLSQWPARAPLRLYQCR